MDLKLTTTTQEEISKDKLWDIKAAYALDCEKVKKWLNENARQALGGDLNRDRALAKYPSLSVELEQLYKIEEMSIAPKVMQQAKDGVFKQKAPSTLGIICMFLVFLMTAGLELAFFSYLVFFREAGGMLIGLAVLLLTGGILAGLGVTDITIHAAKSKYIGTEEKVSKLYIGFLVAGILLIVGITVFRWVTGGVFAGITAAFFGLAVTTTEIVVEYKFLLRRLYIDQMFRAQEYYAATQFRKDLGDTKSHEDDTWFIVYKSYIDEVSKTIRDTTK